jgi:preprotein translocase subunit SecE
MATATKKSGGFLARAGKFFKEVRSELKKVTWPNRQELVSYTTVVILSVIVVAVIIWVADSAFTGILNFIINK